METEQTNLKSTVRVKRRPVSETSLPVITEIAYLAFIFVMVTMTASIILMKMKGTNVVSIAFNSIKIKIIIRIYASLKVYLRIFSIRLKFRAYLCVISGLSKLPCCHQIILKS